MLTYHLEQCQIRASDGIEIDVLRAPFLAFGFVAGPRRDSKIAGPQPSAKQLNAGDGKDQPEEKTDQKNVEDRRNGLEKGVHHQLETKQNRVKYGEKESEGSVRVTH